MNGLIYQKSSNAIELLINNQDKIDRYSLSLNENPDKIYWVIYVLIKIYNFECYLALSQNHNIFTYDYKKIKKNFKEITNEIKNTKK